MGSYSMFSLVHWCNSLPIRSFLHAALTNNMNPASGCVTCLLDSPWRRRPLECFGLIQPILHALADYNCCLFSPSSECFKCISVTQWLEYGGNGVRCCVGEFSCMNIVYEYLFCYWVSSTIYANRLLYICVGGCSGPGCNSCKFLVDLCVSDPIVEPCPIH